jgi:hypothetical protein
MALRCAGDCHERPFEFIEIERLGDDADVGVTQESCSLLNLTER